MRTIIGTIMMVILVAQFSGAADEKAEALKKLSGTWKGRVENGATGHQLVITAESIKGTKDGAQDLGSGSFVLDVTTKPWTLDGTGTDGGFKGKKFPGICSVEGDTMKWCVSTGKKPRPTEFKTGAGNFCLVLARQK